MRLCYTRIFTVHINYTSLLHLISFMSLSASPPAAPPNSSIISEGDSALAYSADLKRYHTFQLRAGTTVRLWKHKVRTDGAIGHYYGSRFVVRGGHLELFNPNKLEVMVEEHLTADEATKDNRDLLDVASNQKITRGEIEELKESELAGEQLISEIVSGSSTFCNKSEFSQLKYISRKKAKHLPVIFIYRPSLRHLSPMHYHLRPDKIGFLRLDTLSQLLSLANVRYGSRLLVVDNFGGLIIGGVLERMGGGGNLVELFTTEIIHPRPVLSTFSHLSPLHWDCLSPFPLRRLSSLREPAPQEGSSLLLEEPTQYTESALQSVATDPTELGSMDVEALQTESDTTQAPFTEPQPHIPVPPKKDRYTTAKELLLEGGFDGIILASKHNPVSILEACLPLISPSSPLLVYCVFPELIALCNEYFHQSSSIILKNLSTSWLRAYQPLEAKLHPEMMCNSCRTGYILYGVRVKTYPDPPSSPQCSVSTEGSGSPSCKKVKLV